jgi:hypothetical protein
MARLVGLSVLMLGFGYVGEVNPGKPALQVAMWSIGCVFGLGIFVPLGLALRQLPDRVSRASAVTVRRMATLVLIGWLVYPLGYLQPLLGFPADLRWRHAVDSRAPGADHSATGRRRVVLVAGGAAAVSGGRP